MKYQIFVGPNCWTHPNKKKTNKSSFVNNYFSFVFSQFSLSALFMKFVASNWLSRRYFESSEIQLLYTQICGAATNISKFENLGKTDIFLTRFVFRGLERIWHMHQTWDNPESVLKVKRACENQGHNTKNIWSSLESK